MFRCPMCESARIVQVVSSTRRAFCVRCGARWVQDGQTQRSVQRIHFVTAAPPDEAAQPTAP